MDADNARRIHVQGLTNVAMRTDDFLRTVFSQFGAIDFVRCRSEWAYAFVTFSSPEYVLFIQHFFAKKTDLICSFFRSESVINDHAF